MNSSYKKYIKYKNKYIEKKYLKQYAGSLINPLMQYKEAIKNRDLLLQQEEEEQKSSLHALRQQKIIKNDLVDGYLIKKRIIKDVLNKVFMV